MKALKNVGLIGLGRAGLLHGRNLKASIPDAELVALCDANRDHLEAAGQELAVATRLTDYRDVVRREDLDAVCDLLRQDDPILTQSKNVRAFEEEWSRWLGVDYSVFVNSGSSANPSKECSAS